MAVFTKQNGILKEVTERLSLKAPGPQGHLDYEDTERLREIAQMISADLNQTLQARQKLERGETRRWDEDNAVIKALMEKADPGTIKIAGAAALTALADRWSQMENPIQRKAEMLAVAAVEGNALRYSIQNNLVMAGEIPDFMITIWGARF
jgi:hypothetical protein